MLAGLEADSLTHYGRSAPSFSCTDRDGTCQLDLLHICEVFFSPHLLTHSLQPYRRIRPLQDRKRATLMCAPHQATLMWARRYSLPETPAPTQCIKVTKFKVQPLRLFDISFDFFSGGRFFFARPRHALGSKSLALGSKSLHPHVAPPTKKRKKEFIIKDEQIC